MTKKPRDHALVIEYKELGTISLAELIHALLEDLQVLQEELNVRFVTGARIRIPVTNEYGEPCKMRSKTGVILNKINTSHFRPSCLDYEL